MVNSFEAKKQREKLTYVVKKGKILACMLNPEQNVQPRNQYPQKGELYNFLVNSPEPASAGHVVSRRNLLRGAAVGGAALVGALLLRPFSSADQSSGAQAIPVIDGNKKVELPPILGENLFQDAGWITTGKPEYGGTEQGPLGRALWIKSFEEKGEVIAQKLETSQVPVEPGKSYMLRFLYKVNAETGQGVQEVKPSVNFMKVNKEGAIFGDIQSNETVFDSTTGEWQIAQLQIDFSDFRIDKLRPMLSIDHRGTEAKISFTEMYFGKIINPSDPEYRNPFDKSQKA